MMKKLQIVAASVAMTAVLVSACTAPKVATKPVQTVKTVNLAVDEESTSVTTKAYTVNVGDTLTLNYRIHASIGQYGVDKIVDDSIVSEKSVFIESTCKQKGMVGCAVIKKVVFSARAQGTTDIVLTQFFRGNKQGSQTFTINVQ